MLPYYQTPHDVTRLPAWQQLSEHRQAMQDFSLRQAFAEDPGRFASFSMDSCGLFLDYSKNLITPQTIELLMRLAREAGLQPAIEALLDGKPVNASEGRPALHTALRRPVGEQILVNGRDVMPEVHRVLGQMTDLFWVIIFRMWVV